MAAGSAVATAALIAGAVAATAGATTSGIAAKRAKDAKATAEGEANTHKEQLDAMIANRPAFKNPYENLTNQFENLDNPYANMTVATEAYKMQAEQSDNALANSLDIMMETGMGAGGATALAQAALQSKRGIAASINAQETQNKKLEAQGEQQVAVQRAQGAQRLDEMKAKGDTLEQQDAINFHEAQMSRTAGLMDNELQNAADADAARSAAIMGIGSAIASGASIAGGGASGWSSDGLSGIKLGGK